MKNLFYLFLALLFTILSCSLSAQVKPASPKEKQAAAPIKKKDVFVKKQKDKNGSKEGPLQIGMLLEYISLDHKTANQLLGKFAGQAADVEELRDELEKMIDNEKADLVETMWLVTRSGQRGKTESVTGNSYATKFDPPEIPNNIGNMAVPVSGKEKKSGQSAFHMTSAMPTTFDSRNVGSTFEVDAILSDDHKLIVINLAPEIVTRLDDHYFTNKGFEEMAKGVEHVFAPTFYAMKDTTQLEVAPGKYNLLGIHTPPKEPGKRILVLLRADLISLE